MKNIDDLYGLVKKFVLKHPKLTIVVLVLLAVVGAIVAAVVVLSTKNEEVEEIGKLLLGTFPLRGATLLQLGQD